MSDICLASEEPLFSAATYKGKDNIRKILLSEWICNFWQPFAVTVLRMSETSTSGGTPKVEEDIEQNTFRHLHFYLLTDDQPAAPGTINFNPFIYDDNTLLSDMHVQPPRTLRKWKEMEKKTCIDR
jgi:hypothetical protein